MGSLGALGEVAGWDLGAVCKSENLGIWESGNLVFKNTFEFTAIVKCWNSDGTVTRQEFNELMEPHARAMPMKQGPISEVFFSVLFKSG